MSAQRIDVLVIGLGPAGARAAAAAATHGASVLALDRRHEAGVPVQCAEFVPEPLGVSVARLRDSVRQSIGAMDTFVESEPADHLAPFPGRMIDRAAFDARLVDEAMRAGAQCRLGASVRRISVDGEVTLADGTRIAPLSIVGADGPRSIAGRAIGHVNRSLVESRQVCVPLLEAHDATDIFLSAAIPGGYGWLFPKGRVANLGAGVTARHRGLLKGIVEALHRRLAEEGRVGREILVRTGGAIPVGGPLPPCGALGRVPVLLAGDAAGLTNPVTGAGIAAAVQSGGMAGDAAALFVAGSCVALQDYEQELDALFGASLARALHRRLQLLRSARTPAALRRAWIAYPEYWSGGVPA